MNSDLSFGRWLKRRRQALGLTQAELARRVGYATATIRKLEADVRVPSRELTEKLAEHLKIAPEERAVFISFARDELSADGPPLPAQTAVPVPQRQPHRYPNNIPAPSTSLIGRQREVQMLRKLLLEETVRLVTLTGAGGVGKTRLSLYVAADMMEHEAPLEHPFEDGVFFVALATISNPDLVVFAIAQVLGVRASAGDPVLNSVKEEWRDKRILLLLDNFEHVASAAALITDLLTSCPGLKVLVTSRAVLRLSGEHVFSVPPLALPDLEHEPRSIDDQRPTTSIPSSDYVTYITQYPAVELFIQRAQAARSEFCLVAENALTVAQICHYLDGLPLAIELAAARIRLLPPKAMLTRLVGGDASTSLELLTGGGRDVPVRQQTLRATIAWSYDLLNEDEQTLFRRLAIFVSGFTLAAVEAVLSDRQPLVPSKILDQLESLVDKSLLQQQEEPNGEPRFTMLETLREYALERLTESSEAEAMQRRHASFFLALVERAEPELRGAHQVDWLNCLEREHDNLRAALRCGISDDGSEIGLRLAASLWRFWYIRGYYREGQGWLEAELARRKNASSAVRLKALFGAGMLAWSQADYDAARSHFEACLMEAQEAGEWTALGNARAGLGLLALAEGDHIAARAYYEASLGVRRMLGDRWDIGNALINLGLMTIFERNYAAAQPLIEEGLALKQAVGDRQGVAQSLIALGEVARCQGDYETAEVHYGKSLVLAREVGDQETEAWSLHNQGYVAHQRGELRQAAALFEASLALFRKQGQKVGMVSCVAGLAAVAGAEKRFDQAAKLFGAVAGQIEAIRARLDLSDSIEHKRHLATVQAQLDEATFAVAWTEGRAMTLEQAVRYALGER